MGRLLGGSRLLSLAAASSGGARRRIRQDGVMQQPRDFSMAGAVDLGARQAAAKRRQQASPGQGGDGTGGESGFVFEATEETFNTDVIGRAQAVPVIVDLWAEWGAPCKRPSPLPERLAHRAAGAPVLAKVDCEPH